MTYPEEAIGVARAAKKVGMRCIVGFTTETDGTIPKGMSLGEAVTKVDERGGPDYFVVNCSHPDHFIPAMRKA